MTMVQLGDVVEFLDSKRQPVKAADRVPGPYPYYGANGQQGTIDGYIFNEPLVLLAEDGGHFFEPSRGIAYKIDGKTWVNNHAHVLRPKSDTDIGYLCLVLKNMDVTTHLTGSTRPKLTKSGASRIHIPLPSLSEQKRIAVILDAADELRTKRRESIHLLDDLIQSTFLEMFGDPVTNPMGWEISQLGELCLMKSGGTPSRKNPEFFKGNVPWITTPTLGARYVGYDCANELITEKAIDSSATKLIPAGSILIGVRVGVGKVSIASCDICTNQDIISLVNLSELLSPDFLRYQIATYEEFLASQKRGATIQGIVSNSLKKLLVYIPPFDLQNQFANIVQSIEDQKTRLQSHVNELDTLFASLQQRAFNGNL